VKNSFLIVAHYSRFLVQFELSNLHILQDMGYEVHYATNYLNEDMYDDALETIRNIGVIVHQIDFVRSPYNIPANLKAYRQLKRLMKSEKYCGVHCHTPMAGALARLAANATNTKPVLYTAHGFHFYNGAPLKDHLIYETAERFLARYTDAQITINKEDYAAAQTFKLHGRAHYVPGVGIDVGAVKNIKIDRAEKRRELGVPENAFLFVSVGELIPRKNQTLAIEAFALAKVEESYFLICGTGVLKGKLEKQVETLRLQGKVRLAGFRSDVYEILQCADAFVLPSLQEGLPVALMEAMAAGLPCIASNIRGNADLMPESKYLFDAQNIDMLAGLMRRISQGKGVENEKQKNATEILKYDKAVVSGKMQEIYKILIQ
jgi:glycosyltransferase involved in cell wall biosynthesis